MEKPITSIRTKLTALTTKTETYQQFMLGKFSLLLSLVGFGYLLVGFFVSAIAPTPIVRGLLALLGLYFMGVYVVNRLGKHTLASYLLVIGLILVSTLFNVGAGVSYFQYAGIVMGLILGITWLKDTRWLLLLFVVTYWGYLLVCMSSNGLYPALRFINFHLNMPVGLRAAIVAVTWFFNFSVFYGMVRYYHQRKDKTTLDLKEHLREVEATHGQLEQQTTHLGQVNKELEQATKQSGLAMDETTSLKEQLAQVNQFTKMLGELAHDMTASPERGPLMEKLDHLLSSVMDTDVLLVGYLPPHMPGCIEMNTNMHHQYQGQEQLIISQHYRPSLWALSHGQGLLLNDYAIEFPGLTQQKAHAPQNPEVHINSLLHVLIKDGAGNTLGLLGVESLSSQAYTLEHQRLLKLLASYLAVYFTHRAVARELIS